MTQPLILTRSQAAAIQRALQTMREAGATAMSVRMGAAYVSVRAGVAIARTEDYLPKAGVAQQRVNQTHGERYRTIEAFVQAYGLNPFA